MLSGNVWKKLWRYTIWRYNNIRSKIIPDFDILCAGFPCQTFSIAGEKKGFEDAARGNIVFWYL